MNYLNAFAISATGMNAEKAILDATATNLANTRTSKGLDGKLFRPLHVTVTESRTNFATELERMSGMQLHGAQIVGVEQNEVPPRKVYDPGNPDADDKGMVSYPGVNQVTEMVNLSTALAWVSAFLNNEDSAITR